MKKKFALLVPIFCCAFIGLCHGQNPFKNQVWYCVKSVDHSETAADRIHGDAHGFNPADIPRVLFYYDFRNNNAGRTGHFTRYKGNGEREDPGTWDYTGLLLKVRGDGVAPENFRVVSLGDANVLILKSQNNTWYYMVSSGKAF